MPIQEQNIVFVESQVMDDVPEGGGAATGRVIVDGRMNNVFEDISDLDRAYGRFNLRKIFLAVRTLSTDLYGGAKTVVTALPQDDALGYTLFSSSDPFDTRQQAANKVEAYLYKGPTWGGYLFENHIAGMRAISVIQRVDSRLPTVGKTLCIVQDEGLAGEKEQYVRVTKVDVVEQQFADVAYQSGNVEFARWIVTMQLSDALRHNFAGHSPRYADNNYNFTGRARIRDTTVADATRYYGAQRTTAAANIGDLQVRAASQFTKLVPSAQTETPLVNMALNPSVVVSISAGDRTVDVVQQAHTLGRDVTAESRRLNWIETLSPIPAPGSLSVSYLAQGNWYELRDDGTGTISSSEASAGAGTINYTTGAMSVTLGALPDAGSAVMMVWGSPVHYTSLVPSMQPPLEMVVEPPEISGRIEPGTLVLTWTSGGQSRTATDDGLGALTGDATGTVDYVTARIVVTLPTPPTAGTNVRVQYDRSPFEMSSPAEGSNTYVVGSAIKPKSVSAWGKCRPRSDLDLDVFVRDDGLGNLRATLSFANKYIVQAGTIAGTVDYSTGTITLNPDIAVDQRRWSGMLWADVAVGPVPLELGTTYGGNPAVSYEKVVTTVTYPPADVQIPVSGGFGPVVRIGDMKITLVPNSLRVTYGGKTYDDRNGVLYADIDPVTGSGIVAGSVNYATGQVTITYYATGATGAPVVTSALGVYGAWSATEAAFRTGSAPIKPESMSITAVTAGQGGAAAVETLTAVADADGTIVGAKVLGRIDYETGVANVQFGTVSGGAIAVPIHVDPTTIRYNAVAYSYLPLDADILGIDPVRLPSDGRVPIYRAGDVVMVMHAAETAPETVANGGTINCGRGRIGWIRVIDATGASVVGGYDLDRATGVVTFSDVSGMVMPVKVRHTVGDLRQITDAQITGQLTLARPLSHNFPAGETIVASCLIHGDRRARVSAVWDQATWGGTWSDSLIGSEATATLDTIAHPIVVTNEGAETERWLLRWTSTTNVELIGQRRGLVFSGPFTADIAPINPRTRNTDGTGGVPYLQIPVAANGGGWSTGNVVRINTVGALADIWIARSIQQSDEPLGDGEDGVELYALGNIDRP